MGNIVMKPLGVVQVLSSVIVLSKLIYMNIIVRDSNRWVGISIHYKRRTIIFKRQRLEH